MTGLEKGMPVQLASLGIGEVLAAASPDRSRFEALAYTPEPSWATYASLLASSAQLLEKLRPLGARDHVDVETFMHAATAKPPRPKAKPVLPGAVAGARAKRGSPP